MVETFLPNPIDKFEDLYSQICHKKYTTACLQELLFYNRESNNLLDLIDEFNEI